MIFIFYKYKSCVEDGVWHDDIRKEFSRYRNTREGKKSYINLRFFI
jgi:hypothetical protein